MIVSTAKAADLPELLELLNEYHEWGEDIEELDDKRKKAYLDDFLKDSKHGTVFIGRTSAGIPVGFATVYLTPHTLQAARIPTILDLFIRENQREKGFARQMFDHILRWAKEKKYTRVVCTVENMNMVAQYLFDPYQPDSTGWVHFSIDLNKE